MATCRNINYLVRKTDNGEPPILVGRLSFNSEVLDIDLIGQRTPEYGQEFNNNMLNILENFSCPASDPNLPILQQTPDISQTFNNSRLSNPIAGQLWHNSSINKIYYYEVDPFGSANNRWVPLTQDDDVAGNYGQLESGELIPKPVSVLDGYVFPYEECSWIVSPHSYPDGIIEMVTYTDIIFDGDLINEVRAYCRVRLDGSVDYTGHPVNYQIIGIKGGSNLGVKTPPPV